MKTFIFVWWWRSHQSLARVRFTYFQILYYALERWTRTHNQNTVWDDKLTWLKNSHSKVKTNDEFVCKGPSTLSSSASESPMKRSYKSQSPLSMQAEMYDRTEKPVVCSDTSHEHRHHHRFVESKHSASFSEWDVDKAWSSQEWKSDELMEVRTGRPVVCPQGGAHQFVIEDDETESELW